MAYWGGNPFTNYSSQPQQWGSSSGSSSPTGQFNPNAMNFSGSGFNAGGGMQSQGWGQPWGQGGMGSTSGQQPQFPQMPPWMQGGGMGGSNPYSMGSSTVGQSGMGQSFGMPPWMSGAQGSMAQPNRPRIDMFGQPPQQVNTQPMPFQQPTTDPTAANYGAQQSVNFQMPQQPQAPVGNPMSGPYGIWGSPQNMTNTGGGIFGPATRSLLGI